MNAIVSSVKFILPLLFTVLLIQSLAKAEFIVVPNEFEAAEASNGNRLPFFVRNGRRYQQIYDASQFWDSGTRLITEIAVRPNGSESDPIDWTISALEIQLSTTTRTPDALSPTFATNTGPDLLTVYKGSYDLSSLAAPGPNGTRSFDIVINFERPFPYDPSAGNLLLEIKNQSPETHAPIDFFFDSANVVGDSISRVHASGTIPEQNAGATDTSGLVTRFTVVPEPASQTALLTFAVLLASCRGMGARALPATRISKLSHL